jgi:hypothetical protein
MVRDSLRLRILKVKAKHPSFHIKPLETAAISPFPSRCRSMHQDDRDDDDAYMCHDDVWVSRILRSEQQHHFDILVLQLAGATPGPGLVIKSSNESCHIVFPSGC